MNELVWCVEHQFLLLVLVFSPYVNRVLGTGKILIWDWGCSPVGRVPSVHEALGSTSGTSYSCHFQNLGGEAGGLEMKSHPTLHSELNASLGYMGCY